MNYRKIPEIKSYLETIEEVRNMDDEDKKNAFEVFNFDKGKKLQLTVKVDDPDIVNAILTSEWGDEGLMPGMSIEDVRMSDFERNDVIEKWLEEKLNDIRNNF